MQALAEADPEEVNSLWAGLGYYRRARFLHQGAQAVVGQHGGILPATAAELKNIPGIGDYTAGAIASIAFEQQVDWVSEDGTFKFACCFPLCNVFVCLFFRCLQTPLVDGNVIRVFSRLRAIAANPKHKPALSLIWALAAATVRGERPGDFNQALMELGATVCVPKGPDCSNCPVATFCHAYAECQQHQRPAVVTTLVASSAQATSFATCSSSSSSSTTTASTFSSSTTAVADASSVSAIALSQAPPSFPSAACAASPASPVGQSSKRAAKGKGSSVGAEALLPEDATASCTICDALGLRESHGGADVDVAWDVVRYPLKAMRKPPREESFVVGLVTREVVGSAVDDSDVLIIQRPQTGLLAGQWELPAVRLPVQRNVATVPAPTSAQVPVLRCAYLLLLLCDLVVHLCCVCYVVHRIHTCDWCVCFVFVVFSAVPMCIRYACSDGLATMLSSPVASVTHRGCR